jgi:hypothetical protein
MSPRPFLKGYHDSRDAGLGTKAYNADLAEADQSHHEESADSIPDLETESAAAMSVAEEVSSEGQSTQTEGVATADSCVVNNTADATEVRCFLHVMIQWRQRVSETLIIRFMLTCMITWYGCIACQI